MLGTLAFGSWSRGTRNVAVRSCTLSSWAVTGKKGYPLIQKGEMRGNGTMNVDLASLKKFKEYQCHLFIKSDFKFDADTPGVGYRAGDIGKHVQRIRMLEKQRPDLITDSDRKALNEMGFVWEARPATLIRVIEGIITFKKLTGDYLVPVNFRVPYEDPKWSENLWGFALGDHYRNLLDKDISDEETEILEQSGISIKKQRKRRHDQLLLAMRTFAQLKTAPSITDTTQSSNDTDNDSTTTKNTYGKGPFYVKPDFVIPLNDHRWPVSVRGLRLGIQVKNIKYKGYFSEIRDELEDMGFDFHVNRRT